MVKSRFLSLFMSLVLALGLCPLPAFAAPTDDGMLAVAAADDDGEDGDGLNDEDGDEAEDTDDEDGEDEDGDDGEDPEDGEDPADSEDGYLSLDEALVKGVSGWTYDGTSHVGELHITVILEGKELIAGKDYELVFEDEEGDIIDPEDVVDAGEYIVYAVGIGHYDEDSETDYVELVVERAANPLKASAKKKTVSLKAKNLKKKAATTSNVSVSGAKGTVKYKNASTNKAAKKFTVDKKGAVKVTKGLKAGKYPVVVQVTADGDDNYKKGSIPVSFTVQVKK